MASEKLSLNCPSANFSINNAGICSLFAKAIAFSCPNTIKLVDKPSAIMHDGCNSFAGMKEFKKADEKKWNEVCSRMRQDGPFVEAGENDNLIVQRLGADPHAVGIFGYSFLYENSDKLKAVKKG